MRLSHSAMDKYNKCAASYKYHYIEGIRGTRIPSPFLFGGAIDEALNVLLLTKMDTLSDEELELSKKDPKSIFDYNLAMYQVGDEMLDIRTSELPQYFKSDFDPMLLLEEDWRSLDTYIANAGYSTTDPEELYFELTEIMKAGNSAYTDICYMNYCSWLSLRRKGHLMIDTYKSEILPKIKKVHSIQRKIELENEDGDTIIGYVDFEAELVGHEGILTVDNKTSSKKYSADDVNEKGQLVLYSEATGNAGAAYIVLIKKARHVSTLTCKTCGEEYTRSIKACTKEIRVPGKREGTTKKGKCGGELLVTNIESSIDTQILVDTIKEERKDLLFDKIDDTLVSIREGEFSQNRNECFAFGRKCIYFNLCRENSMDGLKRKRKG